MIHQGNLETRKIYTLNLQSVQQSASNIGSHFIKLNAMPAIRLHIGKFKTSISIVLDLLQERAFLTSSTTKFLADFSISEVNIP